MKAARIPPAAVATMLRQLAHAERGGLPLQDALAILAKDRELKPAQVQLLSDLAGELSAGRELSAALEAHPSHLPAEAVALIRSAEAEKARPAALDLVAADYEAHALEGAALRGALAWPAIIAAVLLVLTVMVMSFVVPAFKQVFASFGADLPASTLTLIAISDSVAQFWYLWVALIAVAVFLAARRILPGRAWLDPLALRLPFVRPYLLTSFAARVGRALAAAAEGRLPPAPAFAYLRATTANRRLAGAAGALEAQLRSGKALSAAVRDSPDMPGQLAVAVELGERSNRLGPALRQVVAMGEGDAARSLMRLQQATLVALYLCLGILVAFVLLALYLPIFHLGAAV
ncbi:MAG: type II secretion system F family protein [Betaproteobacteria bacterium]